MRYADDMVLFFVNQEGLQNMLDNEYSKDWTLSVSNRCSMYGVATFCIHHNVNGEQALKHFSLIPDALLSFLLMFQELQDYST